MLSANYNQSEKRYDIGKQIRALYPSRAGDLTSEFLYKLNRFAPIKEYQLLSYGSLDKKIVHLTKETFDVDLNDISGDTITFLSREPFKFIGEYNDELKVAKLGALTQELYAHETFMHRYVTSVKLDAINKLGRVKPNLATERSANLEEALAAYMSGRIFGQVFAPNYMSWENPEQEEFFNEIVFWNNRVGPKQTLVKMMDTLTRDSL